MLEDTDSGFLIWNHVMWEAQWLDDYWREHEIEPMRSTSCILGTDLSMLLVQWSKHWHRKMQEFVLLPLKVLVLNNLKVATSYLPLSTLCITYTTEEGWEPFHGHFWSPILDRACSFRVMPRLLSNCSWPLSERILSSANDLAWY